MHNDVCQRCGDRGAGSAGMCNPCDVAMNGRREDHIGFLVRGNCVVCTQCANERGILNASKLYRVNVGDYRQTCHHCGKVLVEGKTPAWCELFPHPSDPIR